MVESSCLTIETRDDVSSEWCTEWCCGPGQEGRVTRIMVARILVARIIVARIMVASIIVARRAEWPGLWWPGL